MAAAGECKGDPAAFCESKAEDKPTGDAKICEEKLAGPPALALLSVDCGPSDCPVGERLELSMDFALDQPLRGAWWEVKFLVDSVNERHVVRLGATDERDYPLGNCSMYFQVPRVPVEGIKPCTLANTGLLVATLMWRGEDGGGRPEVEGKGGEGEEQVAQVNLVVQVTDADSAQGALTRVIYSPLE